MKKLLKLLALSLALMLVVACNKETGSEESPKPETKTTETKPETKATETKPEAKPTEDKGEYVETMQEKGPGTAYLVNESGTTEDGKVLVVFADQDTTLTQIGLETKDFDGGHLTYVYIDGKLSTKEQLGEGSTSLTLEQETLKPGKHTVTLKQFNNDQEDGDPVMVKVAQYEVKQK